MSNGALSDETLLHQLHWRYAVKKYDPAKQVSPDDWKTLEDAVVLSPSSYGLQPWKMLVINDPAIRAKLRPAAYGQSQVTDASHFVVFAIRKNISEAYVDEYIARIAEVTGAPVEKLSDYRNRMVGDVVKGPRSLQVNPWAQRQAYIGLGFLLESAALLGIDATPMEGFEPEKFDQILGLAEQGLAATVMCAIGYRAADDQHAKQPKVRFPKEKVIQYF
jgi:nitroreductase